MKYSNLKRFIERNMIGGMIEKEGVEYMETIMSGFQDIVADYFTI